MSEVYELTLTTNYVSDWTLNDAIRELIQNGTDQEIMDPGNTFSINYDAASQCLTLSNIRSKLSVNTLLLGRSSKANNVSTVGQFGEGYKIAALVLTRLGHDFIIHNNEKYEVWRARFKNSEKWKEKILAFYIDKVETQERGLTVKITNITQDEYFDLQDTWLGFTNPSEDNVAHTQFGDILKEEDYKGNIYVNGLYIEHNYDLRYGYNIKPAYVTVERDRHTCSSWDVGTCTAKMIAEAMVTGQLDMETVTTMVHEECDDVRYLEYNTCNNNVAEVKKVLVNKFNEQYQGKNVIPVNNEAQSRRVKALGGTPVVVPSKVYSMLQSVANERMNALDKLPEDTDLTLKQQFQRWYDAYSDDLDASPRTALAELINKID